MAVGVTISLPGDDIIREYDQKALLRQIQLYQNGIAEFHRQIEQHMAEIEKYTAIIRRKAELQQQDALALAQGNGK